MPRRSLPEPPPSPDELSPSQRDRRARIINVAYELLAGRDFESIQIKDIADRANVALGTVYHYFSSKEHLFAIVYFEWVQQLRGQIDRQPLRGSTNHARLAEVLHKSIRAFQNLPQFYRVIMILQVTKDSFAQDMFRSASQATHLAYTKAIIGLDQETTEALLTTVMAILDAGIRSWVLGLRTIDQVKHDIDVGLWLLFEFSEVSVTPSSIEGDAVHTNR